MSTCIWKFMQSDIVLAQTFIIHSFTEHVLDIYLKINCYIKSCTYILKNEIDLTYWLCHETLSFLSILLRYCKFFPFFSHSHIIYKWQSCFFAILIFIISFPFHTKLYRPFGRSCRGPVMVGPWTFFMTPSNTDLPEMSHRSFLSSSWSSFQFLMFSKLRSKLWMGVKL